MRKRVLFLSHIPPYPAMGGDHIRICQTLEFLTAHFDVDIAYLSHLRLPQHENQKSFNSSIKNEYVFYVSPLKRFIQAIRTLFNCRAEIINHYDNYDMRCFVSNNVSGYDFVFCASLVTGQYLLDIKGIKAYLDMTDSFAMNRANEARTAKGLMSIFLREESRRLRKYEAQALKHFSATAYISEVDSSFIHGGNKYIVSNKVSGCVDNECCRHSPTSYNILFVGIMDYEPNVKAVNFFAREVFPIIRESIPNAKFIIAGKSPSAKVRRLSSITGVTVTGYVESITPFYSECALVVAPMLSGSGVQNKILEAMSRGCCVLTTPIGFEGIERLSDALVVCKPDATVFADRVVGLLNNADERCRLGNLARNKVLEAFGDKRVDEQYNSMMQNELS